MKALFYVLALLAIGGAAYFSNSNKGKLAEQQQARLDTISTNKKVSATVDQTHTRGSSINCWHLHSMVSNGPVIGLTWPAIQTQKDTFTPARSGLGYTHGRIAIGLCKR